MFLVLISSTYAINISSPANGSNIHYNSSIVFSKDNASNIPITRYQVYFNGTNYFNVSNNISIADTFEYSTTTTPTVLNTYTINSHVVGDLRSMMRSVYSPVMSCYLNISYNDSTSNLTPTCTYPGAGVYYLCIFSNPYPAKIVTNIKLVAYSTLGSSGFVGGLNMTYENRSQPFNYSLSSLYSFLNNIGNYTLNVSAFNESGYVNSSAVAVNMPYNSILNVTAKSNDGTTLTNFTINITDTTDSTYRIYSTLTGFINIDIVRSRNYNVSINASSYIPSSVIYSTPATYQDYQFTLYPAAGITIFIYDETNLSLITQNVNVTLTDVSNPSILFSNTSSGNISFSDLRGGDIWELKFSSVNYSTSRYYLTVISTQSETLNAYLLPEDISENVSICFYECNNAVLPNFHIFENLLTNGSYLKVQDLYTDINGVVKFSFNPIHYYRYNYSGTGYISSYFDLNPPSNSATLASGCNYDVVVKCQATSYNYSVLNVLGEASFNNISKILTFTYTSGLPSGNYSYTASKSLNGLFTVVCGGSSLDSSHLFTCDLTGYDGLFYVQGVYNSSTVFYTQWVNVPSLPKLFDNLDAKDAGYIAGLLMLLIVFSGLAFGPIGCLLMGVVGLIAIFWLGLLTLITLGLIVVDILVVFIISAALRNR